MFEAAVDDGAEELGLQQEILEAGPRFFAALALQMEEYQARNAENPARAFQPPKPFWHLHSPAQGAGACEPFQALIMIRFDLVGGACKPGQDLDHTSAKRHLYSMPKVASGSGKVFDEYKVISNPRLKVFAKVPCCIKKVGFGDEPLEEQLGTKVRVRPAHAGVLPMQTTLANRVDA